MLWAILRIRWRSISNAFTRSPRAERQRAWTALVSFAAGACVIGWLSHALFVLLIGQERSGWSVVLANRLPSLLFFWGFWMLTISGVTVAMDHLYAHREMALLLTAPVPPRGVFVAKFVDMALNNAEAFGVFGLPMAVSYAMARGYLTPEYALRCVVTLAVFSAVPTALGVLGAIAIMRLLPTGRLREVFGALWLVLLSLAYIGLNVGARRLADPSSATATLEAFLAATGRPVLAYGPWAWAGFIVSTPTGYPEAYTALSLLLGAATASLLVGGAVSERLHWRGWVGSQEAPSVPRGVRRGSLGSEFWLRWLPGPVRAFALKDLRSMLRDMRQMSMLLLPAACIVVLLFNLSFAPETQSGPRVLVALSLLPLIGVIALRIAMSSYLGEGTTIWVALASPASPLAILSGKLWYTASLGLPMALVAAAAYGALYGVHGSDLLVVLLLTLAATVTLSGICVGLGARTLELSAEIGRVVVTGKSRLLILGAQALYTSVIVVLMTGAWLATEALGVPPVLAQTAALVATLAASVVSVGLAMLWGARRLETLEA